MSGRGAKGSIKDRLLSILYRIRYKKYLKKKERYYKKNKISLRFVYKFFFRNKRKGKHPQILSNSDYVMTLLVFTFF